VTTVQSEPIRPRSRREWFIVGAALFLALALRLALVVHIHDGFRPLTDAESFDNVASSIADGNGYGDTALPGVTGPSGLRAPAWPTTLGLVYAVAGAHRWTVGLVTEAGVGTVAVALIGVVAAQLFGRRVGFAALVLAAVHPTLILYGSSLMLEPLLMVLELSALAAALQHRRNPRGLRWLIAAGAAAGAACLAREIGVALVPAIALLLWTDRPRWRRRALVAPAVVVLAAVAVIVPWTIRNAVQFHRFVPISTSSGLALAGTYNETSYENHVMQAQWIPALTDPHLKALVAQHPGIDEAELDALLRSEGLHFMADHPGYVAKAMGYNFVRLFDLDGGDQSRFAAQYWPYPKDLLRLGMHVSWVLWALAVVALSVRDIRRRLSWELAVFPILAIVFLAILSGNIRYRASIEPVPVVLVAALAVHLQQRFRPAAP